MVKTDENGGESVAEEGGTKPDANSTPDPTTLKNAGVDGGGANSNDTAKVEEKKVEEATPAAAVVPVTQATTSASVPAAAAAAAVPAPEPEKKMRAVVLTSYGGLKGVKMAERPLPSAPKEGQVTIQVKISGINFQDLLLRLGFPEVQPQPKTPFILGTECIGLVTAVGDNVTKVKVDDLVFALPENGGAWAEFANLEERLLFKVSQGSVPLEVLGSTLPYLVAQLLLSRVAGLEEGSTVLIHSGGGGVGLALKELASLRGIHVIGVAGTGKHEALAGQGFKALIEKRDYVAEVKKLCPEGLDAIFDAQGGDDCGKGISLLAPGGSYILFGSANIVTGENRGFLSLAKSWWTQVEKVSPMKLYDENKSVGGFHLRHLLKTCPTRVQKALNTVWELMAQGKIHPVQDMTYHYEQITQAMQRMHERKNIGKILIIPEIQVVAAEEVKASEPLPQPAGEDANTSATGATANATVTNGNHDGETAAAK